MWTARGRKCLLALPPSSQAELTGSLSLHHSEMTIGRNDGFLAVVVCTNLAFFVSGVEVSACHYEVPGSDPVHFLCDLL